MNLKFAFALVLFMLSAKICGGYTISEESFFISMRKIGDQLLLKDNDSTSRILPIEKPDAHTYIIPFEKSFSFDPAELVDIVHQNLQEAGVSPDYIVEVHNQEDGKIVYSYGVRGSLEESNIPCLERNPPPGQYYIKIYIGSVLSNDSNFSVAQFAIPFFLFLGLVVFAFLAKNKPQTKEFFSSENQPIGAMNQVKIGAMDFCMTTHVLSYKNKRIDLSSKEAKLLKIFATSQNTIIERERLLKEVWEDEGVFVGRSLDVFISRLRKKIKIEPNARLVNIHGRGYKLEVN